MPKWFLVLVLVLAMSGGAVLWRLVAEAERSQTMSPKIGATGVGVCEDERHCVSSFDSKSSAYVAPLDRGDIPLGEYLTNVVRAIVALKGKIRHVEEVEEGYIHAEFRSSLFGFVDDLEVKGSLSHSVVHIRSVSRVGVSDLGVNRKRVESLRKQVRKY